MIDLLAVLSDKQDVGSGGAATVVSTKSYDLGVAGTDVNGNTVANDPALSELHIDSRVTTAFSGGTSVQLQIIQSAAPGLGSPTVLASSAAIPVASLVAGYKFPLTGLPHVTQRYIGAQYVVVGATTVGNISTELVQKVVA